MDVLAPQKVTGAISLDPMVHARGPRMPGRSRGLTARQTPAAVNAPAPGPRRARRRGPGSSTSGREPETRPPSAPDSSARGQHLAEGGEQRDRRVPAGRWRAPRPGAGVAGTQRGHQLGAQLGLGDRPCRPAAGRARRRRQGSTGRRRRARTPSGTRPRATSAGVSCSPAAAADRGAAEDGERDVAAHGGRDLAQFVAAKARVPQRVEATSARGGVGAAARHAAGDRDAACGS